ncbi:polysaccharide deacetylase family protein [Paenibacillus sp. GP183]|uniref:polysaccharide deacetylase family protein n=1 Tax=Paenibacillus sp. GP183 TaxID=1882751 RepID=UPI00149617FA|nr:polysaccharide deacetylase family protein [Paenibacillus sp. GP183]
MYHHIDDQGQGGDTISSSLFKQDLEYLKNEGFSFISYQQFKKFLAGSPIPDNAVLVTFDDGYESYYKQAYPILKSMSVPSIQFVITNELNNPKGGITPYLSREEILSMTQDGELVEMQSHTDKLHRKQNDNAYLTNRLLINGKEETNKEFKQRVISDLQNSVSMLKPLQSYPVDSLAYPYGIYSESAIDFVKQAGNIRYAYTVQPGIADRSSDPYLIPRINAGSPWITPSNLVHRIKIQKKRFNEPLDSLPVRSVMEQVGGSVEARDHGKQLILYFAHQKWNLSSNVAINQDDGQTINLSHGIINKSGVSHISYSDLQMIFGTKILYDKKKKRFYPDPTMSQE